MEQKTEKPSNENTEALKSGQTANPDVDIYVNDEEILLVADLPGVSKEDLSINLENNTLTIEGISTAKFTGSVQRLEFDSLDYRRVFTLPKGLDLEKSVAEFSQGVLHLHLPKSSAGKPTQIKVKGE
ncbi:MAG: Hsp20/alpha crystallin family protein [Pseudomonadota bacterium]